MPYYPCTLRGLPRARGLAKVHLHVAHCLKQALELLHSTGLCHCDVKPENVFLTMSGDAVLGDFGSVVPPNQRAYTTLRYVPVEVPFTNVVPPTNKKDLKYPASVAFDFALLASTLADVLGLHPPAAAFPTSPPTAYPPFSLYQDCPSTDNTELDTFMQNLIGGLRGHYGRVQSPAGEGATPSSGGATV